MIRFLPPQYLAKSTSEVSTDILKQNGLEVVNRWYHSPHGVDLFIWYGSDKNIIKVQLSVNGAILDWSLNGGMRTGIVLEEESLGSLNKIDASELIQFDREPIKTTLDYGLAVLKLMPCLKNHEKTHLLELFTQSIPPSPKPPFWRRVLDRIRSLF